ncbi:MAG: hypothetical protein ACTTJ6_03860 [Treponema sp.]
MKEEIKAEKDNLKNTLVKSYASNKLTIILVIHFTHIILKKILRHNRSTLASVIIIH